MHALVYTGTEKIVYREEKDPTKKPGEALVKVHASGICGSDMHAYHGKDERRIPPLILGHEFSGTSLDGKFKNKEVVINPLISCEKCDYCQNKREHLCPKRTMIGMSTPIQRHGGLAELVSVPEQNIFEVPKGLNMKEAALAEPTAVALHAVLLAEANLKKPLSECKILIQGAGAIGLLCGLVLNKEKNSTNIIMSDPNKKRLDVCEKYLKASFVAPDDKSIKESVVAATILKIQEKKNQKGLSYAIIKFTDLGGVFELFVFSDLFDFKYSGSFSTIGNEIGSGLLDSFLHFQKSLKLLLCET